MAQNGKKLCVLLRTSGAIPYMIVVFGTFVKNYDVQQFFTFFQNSDFGFWVLRGWGFYESSGGIYHKTF